MIGSRANIWYVFYSSWTAVSYVFIANVIYIDTDFL